MNRKSVFVVLALVGIFSLKSHSHSDEFTWYCGGEIQTSSCGLYVKLQLEKLGCREAAHTIICDREKDSPKKDGPKSVISCTAESTDQCVPPLKRRCQKEEMTENRQNNSFAPDGDCVVAGAERCKDGYKLAYPDGPLAAICVSKKDPLAPSKPSRPSAPAEETEPSR